MSEDVLAAVIVPLFGSRVKKTKAQLRQNCAIFSIARVLCHDLPSWW
jgi:hypothetical protein